MYSLYIFTFSPWRREKFRLLICIEYIYSLLEVFVLPSLREPFGLVLLEAMAMEIPVVATATGGPLDIIQSGINGFLVPARDAEALASNIQLLLLNREMTAAIAQSGRITVQRNFTKNTRVCLSLTT